ncbi:MULTISPECIES: hypothetical protein [unclassified Clostridium]|uniref:hypothetical protein n=1 Tax=unclassified Clostridium TaxID=2614128 RepID=UPI0002986A0D|nr:MULTISPECIES: hypothetical protein [unclassified Clostridium]EKQ56383.1 MAG: hypothetical protein A370_01975 [Clostridium sp. Maddingley MBC34-26]
MFIYILNLLNDGLKRTSCFCDRSALEIINDTKYITQVAGIKPRFNLSEIAGRISNIISILNKYNLGIREKLDILNKLIINKDNDWLIKHIYNNNDIGESGLSINSILTNTHENRKSEENYISENKLTVRTNNLEEMKEYYVKYYNGKVGKKRINNKRGITSYTIVFESGIKIKIMSKKGVSCSDDKKLTQESTHIAISVGNKDSIYTLTEDTRKVADETAVRTNLANDKLQLENIMRAKF